MPTAGRSRRIGIVAGSLAVHAILIGLVAIQEPRLKVPAQQSGPPEAIIPILIMPRTPPPSAAPGSKPTEIRLHRRPQRFVVDEAPVAPVVIPPAETKRDTAPAEGPKTTAPSPAVEQLGVNARNALRGRLGCSSANLLNLSRAEREACEDQLAAGAKGAAFPGLGINADKAGALARAAAQKESDYKYMRSQGGGVGTVGAGPSANGNAVGRGNNLPGATSEDLAKVVGSDKPAYKIPF